MRRSPLQSMSDKRRRAERALAAQRPALLERSGGACEARFSPYCTGVGSGTHHLVKRSQGGSHDLSNLMWVCSPCNSAIEDHPLLARQHGLVLYSWERSA